MAPLVIVITVALFIFAGSFGLFLWEFLAGLFRAMTGGYCPHPLC
jgi:hypothetical protein